MKQVLLPLIAFLAVQSGCIGAGDVPKTNGVLTPFQVIIDRDPVEDAAVQALNDAEADLKSGKLRIIRYGLQAMVLSKETEKLKKDYGIEIVNPGCVSAEITIHSAAIYNAVMQRAIYACYKNSLAQLEWRIENAPNQSSDPTHPY